MHKLLSYLIIIIYSCCSATTALSQYYFYNETYYESPLTWETGFSTGGMNCLTDLGGKKGIGGIFTKDINWYMTQACGSIFVATTYHDVLGARLELAFGEVKANDNVLKNDQSAGRSRYLRNLNFRSAIRELSLSLDFYPFLLLANHDSDALLVNPYLFAGVGYFSFRPETFYNNTWINISDYHTEGQGFTQYPGRKPYKLQQFNMPMGLGVKYEAFALLNIRFELSYRKLWTDYLDDVSQRYIDPKWFYQNFSASKARLAAILADRRRTNTNTRQTFSEDIRGNDRNNDTYFSAQLKISLVLGRQRR